MRKLLISTIIAATAASGAFAQSAEDVAEARRAFYTLLGFNMSTLSGMAKGEVDYDADAASAAAKDMLTLTSLNTSALYAEGSSNADLPGKTRAEAAIWEDMAGLQEKGMAFYEAVVALNDAAGNGKEALQGAIGKVGGTCKACHDDFRAKDF